MENGDLTGRVIACAYRVHRELGTGYLEPLYQSALAIEFEEAGIRARREVRTQVRYKGRVIGEYAPDFIVEGRVVVELKARVAIAPAHEAQLVNYLAVTGIEDGLLINFGARVQVRRKFRTYTPRKAKLEEHLQDEQDGRMTG